MAGSLARLNEGIRVYYVLGRPTMIFSGYSSKKGVTQAMITKDSAICLGIPENKISILEDPTTTEEEALAYKKYFGQKHPNLILVTSDIHMPRAMYLFRKAGLNPVAAPSDHILRKDHTLNSFWWSSHKNNFDKFSAALHEYIGLIWAKIS
ncbi:MAG: YdcF family protein [Saprospiraceae bacterium]|nr:YdcF family protein [Saprospiraceae bacterium]